MKRIFSGWFWFSGLILNLFLFLAFATIPAGYIRNALFEFKPSPAENILPKAVVEKISAQSVWLQDDGGMASGFIPEDSNLLFTNQHVVEAACTGGRCKNLEVTLVGSGLNEAKDYEVFACGGWLDICVLVVAGEKPKLSALSSFLEEDPPKLIPGDRVFSVSRENNFVSLKDTDDKTVYLNSGSIESANDLTFVAKLDGRHGYSGSPVFNQNGEVIGLISKLELGFWEEVISFPAFTLSGYMPSHRLELVSLFPILKALKNDDYFRAEVEMAVQHLNTFLAPENCSSFGLMTQADVTRVLNLICMKSPRNSDFSKALWATCESNYNRGLYGESNLVSAYDQSLLNTVRDHIRASATPTLSSYCEAFAKATKVPAIDWKVTQLDE